MMVPSTQHPRLREMYNHSQVILCQRREQKLRLNSLPRALDERVQTRGVWPQSPALSTTPCCHYFTSLGWGRATRRPSAGWKNQVCTQFEVCPHRVLTARVSFRLALEPESRLPIQPGNGQRIQMGKHFCQKGNWFSLKKFSGFLPCPPLPDHLPSRPFCWDGSSKWSLLSVASGVTEVSKICMDKE